MKEYIPLDDRERRARLVDEYLKSAGIRVLDKDWHHTDGTLPIVATERNSLVVVLPTFDAIPRELPRMTRLRMRKLAVAWMNAHGVRFDQVRIDMISVTLLPMGQSNLEHARAVDGDLY